MRQVLGVVVALVCGGARATTRGVVYDPRFFHIGMLDHGLTHCNASSASCGPERECVVDGNDAFCLHAQLLPLTLRDGLGAATLFCGLVLAASAGIGGGGLNVPILLLVFNFEMQEAVVVSTAAVLGNAMSQMTLNGARRHPSDPAQTLIDWDAVLLLLPAQLAGGHFGTIIAAVFPAIVLYILSVALLGLAAFKTLRKAHAQSRKEDEQRAATRAPLLVAPTTTPLTPTADFSGDAAPGSEDGFEAAPPVWSIIPWTTVAVVAAFILVFALDFFFLKAPVLEIRAQRPCSTTYWAWLFPVYPLVALVAAGATRHVRSRRSKKQLFPRRGGAHAPPGNDAPDEEALYSPLPGEGDRSPTTTTSSWSRRRPTDGTRPARDEGDVDWASYAVAAPLAALAIGAVSALLGIGGGELLGPTLLAMGMPPARSSATTATATLFSTLGVLIHDEAQRDLDPAALGFYGFAALGLGLGGGLVGRTAALTLAATGRPSRIAGALGLVLLISAGLMVSDTLRSQKDFTFGHLCHSK